MSIEFSSERVLEILKDHVLRRYEHGFDPDRVIVETQCVVYPITIILRTTETIYVSKKS